MRKTQYAKVIGEYNDRAIEKVRRNCAEQVDALYERFPFEEFAEKRLNRLLRRYRIYPHCGYYHDCYSAGMMAYLYSVHRCAYMSYENVEGYIAKMLRIYLLCAIVAYIIPVKNIMNEAYCRELSRKLRRQFEVQRSKGEYVGPFVSYGYLKDPNDKHRLILDEYAAEVVRGIFQLKIKGYNAQAIADYLNENGVLPPAQYKRQIGTNYKSGFQKSNANGWGAVTVRRILSNDIYIGRLVQGKRGTPNYKIKQMRMRDASKWSVVENNHEPIIDEMMFTLVQRMLQRDTRKSPKEDTVQPLGGIVFCGDCMRGMCHRVVKKGENSFYYYVCSTHKRSKECSSHSFSQNVLERIVYRAIQKQIALVVEMDKLLSEMEHSHLLEAKLKRLDIAVEEKEQEIERHQEFRMKLLEAFHEKLIDREEYDAMRQKYTGIISRLQTALEKIQKERKEVLQEKPGSRTWVAQFAQYQEVRELTREMVVTLIDKVYVYEDKRIKIDFNFRDEITYYQELLQQVEKAVS